MEAEISFFTWAQHSMPLKLPGWKAKSCFEAQGSAVCETDAVRKNPGSNRSTTLKKKSEALRKNHTVICKLCWEKYIVVNMLHFLCFGKFKFSLEWVMFGRLLSWSWRVPCRLHAVWWVSTLMHHQSIWEFHAMALIFWVDCTGKMLPVLNRTRNRVIIYHFGHHHHHHHHWHLLSTVTLVIRTVCSDYTRLY